VSAGLGTTVPTNSSNVFGNTYYADSDGTISELQYENQDVTTIAGTTTTAFQNGTISVLCYGINNYSKSAIQFLNLIWTSFTQPIDYCKSLVHSHFPNCGSVASMMSIFYNTTGGPSFTTEYLVPTWVLPQHGSTNATHVLKPKYFLDKLYSMVQISHTQLARVMSCPWCRTTNNNQTSRFTRKLDSFIDSSEVNDSVANITFTEGSTFMRALSVSQAENQSRQLMLRAGPVFLIAGKGYHKPKCYWNDLFNEALLALSPIASKGVGMAGTYLCGGNAMCGLAGQAIFNWVLSNLNTNASDVDYVPVDERKASSKVAKSISKIEVMSDDE